MSECSKSMCSGTQSPPVDNCYLNDTYTRTMLYRSWNTSCAPYLADYTTSKTYAWEYNGAWYWGSNVILRCLPGFIIPDAYQNVSRKVYFYFNAFALKRLLTNSSTVDLLWPGADLIKLYGPID